MQFVVTADQPNSSYVLPTQQQILATYFLLLLLAIESIIVSVQVALLGPSCTLLPNTPPKHLIHACLGKLHRDLQGEKRGRSAAGGCTAAVPAAHCAGGGGRGSQVSRHQWRPPQQQPGQPGCRLRQWRWPRRGRRRAGGAQAAAALPEAQAHARNGAHAQPLCLPALTRESQCTHLPTCVCVKTQLPLE